MALSGSYNFTLARDDIINRAFRLINVLGEDQLASSTRIAQASSALNSMVKLWVQMGVGLWLNREIVLYPQEDQVKYYMGPNMVSTYSDYAAVYPDSAKTALSAASPAQDSQINVDDTRGIPGDLEVGDYVGIVLDDDSIHWTTITIQVGGAINLASALPTDSGAAKGNFVYGFTTVPQRPLEVISGFRRDKDGNDVVMEFVSLDEYRQLSTKTSEGKPNVFAVDIQITDIIVYVWPEPNDMTDRVHLFVRYPVQDWDSASDNWDFPEGWGEAIVFNLAIRLAAEYGRAVSPEVKEIAIMSLAAMEGSDTENTKLKFRPSRSYSNHRSY